MKRFFLVIHLFLFIASFANGQEKSDSLKGPHIIFEKLHHDFGDVLQGEEVSISFKFTNTGSDSLAIFNALSTCSCTPVIRDTSKKYAPGESGEIIVIFKTKDKEGIQHKVVTVFSNAVNVKSGLSRLSIRVNVIPRKTNSGSPDNSKKK
jgi:hypothetical protein